VSPSLKYYCKTQLKYYYIFYLTVSFYQCVFQSVHLSTICLLVWPITRLYVHLLTRSNKCLSFRPSVHLLGCRLVFSSSRDYEKIKSSRPRSSVRASLKNLSQRPLIVCNVSGFLVTVNDSSNEPCSIEVDNLRGGLGGQAVTEDMTPPILIHL